MTGLDDLEGLLQTKQFYDFMIALTDFQTKDILLSYVQLVISNFIFLV